VCGIPPEEASKGSRSGTGFRNYVGLYVCRQMSRSKEDSCERRYSVFLNVPFKRDNIRHEQREAVN
jgi:hypothetical protein